MGSNFILKKLKKLEKKMLKVQKSYLKAFFSDDLQAISKANVIIKNLSADQPRRVY